MIKKSKIFAAIVGWYGYGLQSVHLLPSLLIQKSQLCLGPFIVLTFKRRKLCSFASTGSIFEVLSWRHRMHFALPCVSNNAIDFKTIIGWPLLGLSVSPWVSEDYLFALLLLLYHFFAHAMYFGKVDHFFAIGEVWNPPLSALLIPLWIVDNGLKLISTHQNADNGSEFFNLFLLVTYGVKQLLFFFFMLILYILEFNQIGSVFLLYLLETWPHLIYLFV